MPSWRAWPWLVGGLALFAADAALAFDGINGADESWMLQIVHRVSNGDALYRDVDVGVTPLSVYLLWAVAAVAGQQILTVKVLSALIASASGLLAGRISLQGRAGVLAAVVCAGVTGLLAARFLSSLYTPLAVLLFLACETVVLSPFGSRPAGALVAGALAGISFAAKQNVGGLALVAVVLSLVLADPSRRGLRRAAAASAAFVAIALATFVAMVASGGMTNALDALGFGKHGYVEYGSISYSETLRSDLSSLVHLGAWADVVHGRDRDLVLSSPPILLPVIAAAVLLVAWAQQLRVAGRRRPDRALIVVSAFAVAAFFAPFPRYDAVHLAYIAGPLLAACAVCLVRLKLRGGRLVGVAVGVAAASWIAFALGRPLLEYARGERTSLGLPHYAGALVGDGERVQATADVRRLRAALPGRTVFLDIDTASFYYLAAELRNPTRFDYPYPTTIDRGDADEILGLIRDGSIRTVCLSAAPAGDSGIAFFALERRLRETLRRGPVVGPCRLWFSDRR